MVEFLDLPTEVLLRIFGYLSPAFALRVVSVVCRNLRSILSSEEYWRFQLKQRYPHRQFMVDPDEQGLPYIVNLLDNLNKENARWRVGDAVPSVSKSGIHHYGSVDSVLLLQDGDLCISGSRDRSLCLWDTDDPANDAKVTLIEQAHKGWIWDLKNVGNDDIYSASWDRHIKHWQLTPTNMTPVGVTRCDSAVLSLSAAHDLVCASTYDHAIRICDARNALATISDLKPHTGAVLALRRSGNYLFSCSEDRKLLSLDLRKPTEPVRSALFQNYILSLSCRDGQLIAGDKAGELHFFDVTKGELRRMSHLRISHLSRLNSVTHTRGAIVVASMLGDRSIRILENSLIPQTLARLGPYTVEPTTVDYSNGVLACGFSDNSVHFWKPEVRWE